MRKYRISLFTLLMILAAPPVMADDATLALAKKKGCLVCHSVTKATLGGKMGPAWNEVTERYRDHADALHKVRASILYGSMGNWGERSMRGMARSVSKEQAQQLAEYIMGLDK